MVDRLQESSWTPAAVVTFPLTSLLMPPSVSVQPLADDAADDAMVVEEAAPPVQAPLLQLQEYDLLYIMSSRQDHSDRVLAPAQASVTVYSRHVSVPLTAKFTPPSVSLHALY